MGAIELRNKIIEIINSSDERFLRMVSALHKTYSEQETTDFYDELPKEIQEILMESRDQARQGKTRSHKEVMDDFRKKYDIA
ncbi:hypothetical protein KORDIASMS9_04238 [Kordia sp. SMS9]|uniref:Uncharacterized protein n=1 Tax=Kordia aestuariivivens TaxID=2759037 RepID=A0ABR7Q485_9FLAO|nr:MULTISPECIES: hypothetical protein [Kordia]AXG71980.1 hypothetical protein KORDIASMS9_04238 [Kordia sp. SMS9]MBC8753337.1 hypothetical protein [Kordia aestuariivivens]